MASALIVPGTLNLHEDEQWVEAVVMLTLGTIVDFTLEELNDYCEFIILGENSGYIMTNISYAVDSCDPSDNGINVKVTADLESF